MTKDLELKCNDVDINVTQICKNKCEFVCQQMVAGDINVLMESYTQASMGILIGCFSLGFLITLALCQLKSFAMAPAKVKKTAVRTISKVRSSLKNRTSSRTSSRTPSRTSKQINE